MDSTHGRRRRTLSAAIGLFVWLAAVTAVTLWRYPYFWIESGERFAQAEALARERRFPAALAEIDRALKRRPADAGFLTFKGYRLLDVGDPASAELTFRRALDVEPNHVDARLGLAATLAKNERRDEALRALDALPRESTPPAQLRRRSQLYGVLKAPAPAIEDLSHLLHADPSDASLLREAATHALTLQDWSRARGFAVRLSAAAETDDDRDFADEVSEMAASGSEAEADQAIESERQEAEVRFVRRRSEAFALLRAGRRQFAEAAFRALVAEGAADTRVRLAYAWMLNVDHRYAQAWQVVEPLPSPSRDPAVLELQARTALWAGRFAEAVHLVPALLSHRPSDAELWKRLAEAWHALGNESQATEALRAYLRLQSQDAVARQQLADLLAAQGSLEAAIAEYELLVRDRPDDPALLRRLGLLYETAGRLDPARVQYERALARAADPDLVLRVARLHRWTAQPAAAVEWYQRYLAYGGPQARAAQAELALSLFDAGQPADSLARLQAMARQTELDESELVTAARAATVLGQSTEAARLLELLAERRPLSANEDRWLAGQYRASGQRAAALRVYERLGAREAQSDPEVLEAIGDLRYDAGAYRSALQVFQHAGDDPRVRLKIARAAAAAGDFPVADRAYEQYLERRAGDTEARLEAARYFASAGRPRQAIPHYRAVATTRGTADLRIELARIYLAAGQFGDAEGWARQALAAGEDPAEGRLALAQALHLQGKNREASAALHDMLKTTPNHAEALAWRGQVAVALDRHLDAYQSFERAVGAGATRSAQLLLWMGNAAQKRGDYARAMSSYTRASAGGASAPQVAAAARDLGAAVVPRVHLPIWVHGDTNDLRLGQGGGGLTVFLPGLAAALDLDISSGTLSQRAFSTDRTRATLTVSHVFPTPRLQLGVGIGIDRFSRADSLVTWRGAATYHLADDAVVGLTAARQPMVPLEGPLPLRQFNRVLDVAAIGPGFYSDGIRLFTDFLTRPTHRAHLEGGVERMQDRNRQVYAYAHYQVPVASGVRRWTVLRPNVFFESFLEKRPSYFTPRHHLTLGTMLHTIRQYPHWDLEVEINPQVLRTDGRMSFGAHGLVNLGIRVGRVTVAGGTFVFYDGLEDYLQWRAGGRITIPLKR